MNVQDLGHSLGDGFQDVPALDLELRLSLPDVDTSPLESTLQGADVEVVDDEVSIISSRIFGEVRQNSHSNHSQRIHGSVGIIYDNVGAPGVVSEVLTSGTKRKRRTANGPFSDLDPSMYNKNQANNASKLLKSPDPVHMPEGPILTCPICMSKLKEETSTKCGHIFCMKCIKTALATNSKCPTCRQKVAKRGGIFRIYLPSTD